MKSVSIIVPVFNEEENIQKLIEGIFENIELINDYAFEVIFVDDGSTDNTYDKLINTKNKYKNLKIIKLARNFGQTAALSAGIDYSNSEYIITMDGDNQNDPKDINLLINELEKGWDLVSGWRKKRNDNFFTRVFISRIANNIISKVSGLKLHDYGCTLKIYRSKFIKNLNLYGDMHRFFPIYVMWMGGKISEISVNHHARIKGKTKYGFGRIFKVFSDIFLIIFLNKYFSKPIHLFGGIGIINLFLSFITFLLMLYLKYSDIGKDFTETPLPIVVTLFFLIAIISFLLGFIAEILVKIYYVSNDNKPYKISDIKK